MTKQNQMFKLIYRSLLLALPVLAFAVPLGWVATPYFEFFNGMAVQPKAKAQGTFGWGLADPHDLPSLNTAEWEPVPGTLPRDYKPYRFAGADPKAEDYQKVIDQAGRELTNPVPRNMENL